jgi:type I site-specific restriction endonuclease
MADHRRNIENISRLFPQITTPLIQSLIGENINLILCNYLGSINSLIFAQVLYTQYGLSLFDKKFKVFDKWIDSLKTDKIIQVARSLNVAYPENDVYSLYDLLKQELNSRNSITRLNFFELYDLIDYINNSPILDLRQSSEKVDIGFGDLIVSKGYPHKYQTDVKIALFEKLKSSNNTYSTILLMPTGSGKTRTAIEYLIDEIRINTNKNILWLVDSPELAEQALQSFKELWQLRGDRSIILNRFYNKFKPNSSINFENGINIVFGTFDKINSEKNNRSELYNKIRTKTNILIIDEAHFSLAATYEDLISNIRNNKS